MSDLDRVHNEHNESNESNVVKNDVRSDGGVGGVTKVDGINRDRVTTRRATWPFLSRAQAAEFLTQMGLTTSPETLASLASKGGGPLFCKFGRSAYYTREDLTAWVEERMAVKRKSNHVFVGQESA